MCLWHTMSLYFRVIFKVSMYFTGLHHLVILPHVCVLHCGVVHVLPMYMLPPAPPLWGLLVVLGQGPHLSVWPGEEVLLFLTTVNSPLLKHMEDMNWVAMLAFMSDIFERVYVLNTSLQGKECFEEKVGPVVCAHVEQCTVEKSWRMFWRKHTWPLPPYNRWTLLIWKGEQAVWWFFWSGNSGESHG